LRVVDNEIERQRSQAKSTRKGTKLEAARTRSERAMCSPGAQEPSANFARQRGNTRAG
jgi:hypothetical protein